MTWCAIRFGVATALSALAAVNPTLAAPTNLTATFLGNQAFRISDGETTLFTDFPYESGSYGYMTWDQVLLEPTPDSYCLVTHGHRDHFAAELVERLGCTVVGPPSVVALLEDGAGVAVNSDPVTLGPLTITPLDTPHNVEHRSYRVEWSGIGLYFSGDTGTTEALAAQEPLDTMFLSPWLFETASGEGTLPPAGRIVIYHHREGEEVPACLPCDGEASCTPCSVPVQGRVLQLDAD